MKAVTYDTYGTPEVLRIQELDTPVPSDHEIQIQTHKTTVTSGDWRARSLSVPKGMGLIARLIFGINRPRQPILGSELVGVVSETGKEVTRFKEGDRVVIFTGSKLGCSAEYVCIPEDGNVVRLPDGLSSAEAVALPFGGTTALDFFRHGNLNAGDRLLINGASGCVGSLAIQIAKRLGAHVTGICSGKNVDLVTSLGADRAINYELQDFGDEVETYDIIMDTVGTAPFHKSKNRLTKNGRLLLVMGGLADMLRAPWVAMTSQRRIVAGGAAEKKEDLEKLVLTASEGNLRPVIDREYTVEQIVEAHHHVDSGRKRGSVVINWQTDSKE